MLNPQCKTKLSILLGLALTVALLGCDSSSPTDPDQFPFTLSGNLARGGEDTYLLPMSGEGVVKFTFEKIDLIPADPDATPPTFSAIGFRLGRNTTECAFSSDRSFLEGDSVLFTLSEREYCLEFYDSGFIPGEDDTLDYTVFLELIE